MLVDDDPLTNMINSMLLRSGHQFHVQAFENPLEALEYLRGLAHPEPMPEVIFLDINMPQIDGWEFLEEYQALPIATSGNCRVFMLTSSIDPEDEERSKTYRVVSGFISKPLTWERLTGLI